MYIVVLMCVNFFVYTTADSLFSVHRGPHHLQLHNNNFMEEVIVKESAITRARGQLKCPEYCNAIGSSCSGLISAPGVTDFERICFGLFLWVEILKVFADMPIPRLEMLEKY